MFGKFINIRRNFAKQFQFRLIVFVNHSEMVIDADNRPCSAFVPHLWVVFNGVKSNGDYYISFFQKPIAGLVMEDSETARITVEKLSWKHTGCLVGVHKRHWVFIQQPS